MMLAISERLGFNCRVVVLVLVTLSGCSSQPASPLVTPWKITKAVMVGKLENPQITEASGLVSSRRSPDLLWIINDGGNAPILYAVGIDGSDLGKFWVEDAVNVDWEALATFEQQDTAYLLIADVGDNQEQRNTSVFYVVKEPDMSELGMSGDASVAISWQVRFTYTDGPHDCEAVAVDAARNRVLLITKRDTVPMLFELPLRPDGNDDISVARPLALIPHFELPTAMDLSPDGRSAVVMTFDSAYLFFRVKNEDWAKTFERQPRILRFSKLDQQEAVGFGYYGNTLYITSENAPAPLIRIDLK